jgi:hypothetical protein
MLVLAEGEKRDFSISKRREDQESPAEYDDQIVELPESIIAPGAVYYSGL